MGDLHEMAWIGRELTPVGFGAFKIGRNEGMKYPEKYALPDERSVEELLNGVLDEGINWIDTAPAYGLSEERIGRAIAHRRDEFLLSTKVGETFEDGKSTYDFSRDAVQKSIQRSLQRLRTDVLDLVLVHSSRNDVYVVEQTDVAPALQALRDKGLIRAIGFSGYTDAGFRAALPWADAIMIEYHLEHRGHEGVIAEAAARRVAVLVKKGLRSGILDAADAITFVLSNPKVTSLVLGSLNLDHIRESLRIAWRVRGKSPKVEGDLSIPSLKGGTPE